MLDRNSRNTIDKPLETATSNPEETLVNGDSAEIKGKVDISLGQLKFWEELERIDLGDLSNWNVVAIKVLWNITYFKVKPWSPLIFSALNEGVGWGYVMIPTLEIWGKLVVNNFHNESLWENREYEINSIVVYKDTLSEELPKYVRKPTIIASKALWF